MTDSQGRTAEEIREIVYAYERVRHGQKAVWLAERGISHHWLTRMRRAVFSGDLDRGLIPRQGVRMTMEERARQYLVAHTGPDDLTREQTIAAQADRIRSLETELDRQKEVSAALGKAIGLLQQTSAQEPGPDPTSRPSPGSPASASGSSSS